MKITLLSHVYNEEYLLPFWLEHHKNKVDHGIIVDYHSTDNSINITKKICPTWTIITTKNTFFDYKSDLEITEIENHIEGYKIVLTVTEFLFCPYDLKTLLLDEPNQCIEIAGLSFLSKTKNELCNVETLAELLKNIEYINLTNRSPRYLHSYNNGSYGTGRHTTSHRINKTSKIRPIFNQIREEKNNFPAYIGCFCYYPWNEKLIQRKLHVKDKMKPGGWGYHHYWDV